MVLREERLRADKSRAAILFPARHERPQGAEPAPLQIGAGQDRENAGRDLGLFGVDRDDAGMRMRRAENVTTQAADRRDIVDIAPASGQQPQILLAPDPLSDRLHRHSPTPHSIGVPGEAGTHRAARLRHAERVSWMMPAPTQSGSGKMGPGFRRDADWIAAGSPIRPPKIFFRGG